MLPTALTTRIVAFAFFGQLAAAEELIDEMRALADVIGLPAPAYGPVFVSAWRGREEAASAVIDAAVREFTSSGEGAVLAFADYARAGSVQRPRSLRGRAASRPRRPTPSRPKGSPSTPRGLLS